MASPDPAARKPAVLVVEDAPAILELVEKYLGEEYAVTGATIAAAGVVDFDTQAFDAVISHRALLGMTGNELAAMIKGRAPEVPIILVTGHEGAEVDTSLFCAFLPAPFTGTQLREALSDALSAVSSAVRTKSYER